MVVRYRSRNSLLLTGTEVAIPRREGKRKRPLLTITLLNFIEFFLVLVNVSQSKKLFEKFCFGAWCNNIRCVS